MAGNDDWRWMAEAYERRFGGQPPELRPSVLNYFTANLSSEVRAKMLAAEAKEAKAEQAKYAKLNSDIMTFQEVMWARLGRRPGGGASASSSVSAAMEQERECGGASRCFIPCVLQPTLVSKRGLPSQFSKRIQHGVGLPRRTGTNIAISLARRRWMTFWLCFKPRS